MGIVDRLKARRSRLVGRVRALRRSRRWFDHLVIAVRRYQEVHGNHLAAAITYFSFLALFPLILFSMFVASFVLLDNPDLLHQLRDAITNAIPGEIGDTLVDMVDDALEARDAIGVFAVLGTLYAGLGWADNLRTAGQTVWQVDDDRSFLRRKLGDLVVLAGLGSAVAVSILLTASGTVATQRLVRVAGLDGLLGIGVFAQVCGVSLAMVADTAVFAWVFARLPRRNAPYREVLAGALLTAVGFEVLKIVGAFYARRVSASPTTGLFGNAIGLLVWLNLVYRFVLLAMAWTAVGEDRRRQRRAASAPPG